MAAPGTLHRSPQSARRGSPWARGGAHGVSSRRRTATPRASMAWWTGRWSAVAPCASVHASSRSIAQEIVISTATRTRCSAMPCITSARWAARKSSRRGRAALRQAAAPPCSLLRAKGRSAGTTRGHPTATRWWRWPSESGARRREPSDGGACGVGSAWPAAEGCPRLRAEDSTHDSTRFTLTSWHVLTRVLI